MATAYCTVNQKVSLRSPVLTANLDVSHVISEKPPRAQTRLPIATSVVELSQY